MNTPNAISQATYNDFVMGLFARNPGDLSKDFAHAAMGFHTEAVYELPEAAETGNPNEVLAELGDALFFHTAAIHVLVEYLEALCDDPADHPAMRLYIEDVKAYLAVDRLADRAAAMPVLNVRLSPEQGELAAALGDGQEAPVAHLDVAKAWVGYGKAPDLAKVGLAMSALDNDLARGIFLAAAALNLTMAEALQAALRGNIAKLQDRYPGGFDPDRRDNIDHGSEMEAVGAAASQHGAV